MEDRCHFLALADPDFFEVPWAIEDTETEFCPPALIGAPAWSSQVQGLWKYFLPGQFRLAEVGWKVHVSARPEGARAVVDLVAEVCRGAEVPWKSIRSERLVASSHSKAAPPTLVGKICVIYPADEDQLTQVVTTLIHATQGWVGPRILGDHAFPGTPVGVRWGAFHEGWIEACEGAVLPAVRVDTGWAPDRRGKPIERPLPESLARMIPSADVERLPVRDVTLVRRHSAGAIYRAELTDGRLVALKEARHHAGVDHAGVDAVARLKHEYAVLQHLAGHEVAPQPIDYWELSHADVAVIEWIQGDTLARQISLQHPTGRPVSAAGRPESYWTWAESTGVALDHLLERVHCLGVAHGDLQPANVVLTEDGPRLVDFECADLLGWSVTTTTGTDGFCSDDPDAFVRDRYSLERVRSCLVQPDVTLLDRRPDLAPLLTSRSAERVSSADASVAGEGGDELLQRVASDLQGRATPGRADQLFPGAEQHRQPLGALSVLSGAAGVLLTLQAIGQTPDPVHVDWLAGRAAGATTQVHGLGSGIEGIALALALLGRSQDSEAVVASIKGLPQNLGWAQGRSGCAVALCELGQLLNRPDLLARGGAVGREVVAAIDDEVSVPGVGLFNGWSGIALSLLRLGELFPDNADQFHDAAVRALMSAHRTLVPLGETLVSEHGSRIDTSLGGGTAGFVFAVTHLPSPPVHLQDAAVRVALGNAPVVAPVAGLRDGLAGSAVAFGRLEGFDEVADAMRRRATWHCVPTHRGWSVLGEQRLRCSDDLVTGSAGLLAALDRGGHRPLAHVLRLPNVSSDICHMTM